MVSLYIGSFPSGKAGSRVLLDHACRDHNIGNMLTHDSLGKPILPDGPEVSISHTAGAAAVAVSARPVGVDIEQIRPVRKNLPVRVLSPEEYRFYQEAGEPPELFFTFWTLKEAYYKYLGTGLPGFPNETEFFPVNGRWTLKGSPLHFEVYQENLLICTLCCVDQEVRVIHLEKS
ncbi:MAG: 4'-phosphopantetheinyl transferase superfamily protein [Oscillospiraceae bacterium]|nr:4'-phosphopantetheinyl transferase superfamily protein [Oscillospiraceae bacterium]